MGLKPLEFADCLTDSPYFRTKLQEHEKELERTSKFIKTLVHHGRDVYNAAKRKFTKANRVSSRYSCSSLYWRIEIELYFSCKIHK